MYEKTKDGIHFGNNLTMRPRKKSPITTEEVYIPDYVVHDFGLWQGSAEGSRHRTSTQELGKR